MDALVATWGPFHPVRQTDCRIAAAPVAAGAGKQEPQGVGALPFGVLRLGALRPSDRTHGSLSPVGVEKGAKSKGTRILLGLRLGPRLTSRSDAGVQSERDCNLLLRQRVTRSEERRVGKECRSRW